MVRIRNFGRAGPEPWSGGAPPPSHALKNGRGKLEHSNSRIFFRGDVHGDTIRFRKRVGNHVILLSIKANPPRGSVPKMSNPGANF
jgi:hypothetical protein